MKNVGNPGGPLPDYMLKEQADLDRWRQIAAQAWCKPNTSHIEMDTRIAEEFTRLLAEAVSAETERCARVAEGGRFLHDDAPDARFGKSCAAAIRRSMISAPFQVIVDKEGNVLACVPINLKEPPK